VKGRDFAGSRAKIFVGVFSIDSAFDSMAREFDIRLRIRHLFAGGQFNLQANHIDTVTISVNRMLDLDARVGLHKIKITSGSTKNSNVPAPLYPAASLHHGSLPHFAAKLFRNNRRRGFLDKFLVASLDVQSRSPM
jgi:hypothetical protein